MKFRTNRYNSSDAIETGVKIFLGMALLALAAFAIIMAIKSHNGWVENCTKQGGHVIDQHTTSSIWISDDKGGHWGTSSSTTYYCYSQDGKLIDIE